MSTTTTHNLPAVNPAENPQELQGQLKLTEANHIIYRTEPYFSLAGPEFHQLTERVRDNGNDLAKSLDEIEAHILKWDDTKIVLLPDSWHGPGGKDRLIDQVIVANTMDNLFEPIDHLDGDPNDLLGHGDPDAVMAGTLLHYQWAVSTAEEMIHEHLVDREVDDWSIDQRIAQAVVIAQQIMQIGYSAMAGIAAHAMAHGDGTTQLEAPRSDAMAVAAKTVAWAGAVARASALTALFRIWPLDC